MIIAIHGPDYSGQLPVAEAIEDLEISYPVADDRDKDTWRAYGMRARPSYALIAADGGLVHRQVGLVTTEATRDRIEALLQ